MVPSVGSSNPPIIRSVVVFPHPDGPSIAKKLPRSISSDSSSTATTSSKRFVTRSMVTSADTSADLCHDVLDLRVVLERIRRQILAVAGLLVAAVRHLARERNQHGHALTGGRVEPLGKCLLRGLDRAVDVSLGAAWHLGDLPARRGVDHVHGPAVHGADPLSAY